MSNRENEPPQKVIMSLVQKTTVITLTIKGQ